MNIPFKPLPELKSPKLPPLVVKEEASKPIKRRFWRWIIGLLLIAVMTSYVWFPPFVEFLLIYETPLEPAEVILLGSTGGALDQAVEMHRKGLAKRILITVGIPEPYRQIEIPMCEHHFILEDLKKAGIPESDIVALESLPYGFAENRKAIRDWIRKNQVSSYLCMPDLYSTRFTQMVHEDCFPEGDVKLVMVPLSGRTLMRKQILSIQNLAIRFVYWNGFEKRKIEPYALEDGLGVTGPK